MLPNVVNGTVPTVQK